MSTNRISATVSAGRSLRLHPGINGSRLEIGEALGGFLFTVGSVVCLLVGLPPLRPFFVAAPADGALIAGTSISSRQRSVR